MVWKNDPAIGAIPHAGHGSVDIGLRTQCGEAVVFDGKNVDELIDFLGDASLVQFEGGLYRRNDDGTLAPARLAEPPVIVVRPPAGDWFTMSGDALQQEFAIVVTVPNQIHQGAPEHDKRTMPTGTVAHTVDLGTAKPAKKAAVKKVAPAKKATPKAK